MTDRENELIECLMQGDIEAIPPHIQGIELSEEQNNFFDGLLENRKIKIITTMKEFKKGDRVRDISVTRRFGTITSVNHYGDPDCLVVLFDDDEEGVCYVKDLEIFPDPKTAFLTELQILLRQYDAKIYVWSGEDGDMSLTFGLKDDIDIRYPNEWCTDYKFEFPITPDNIFNYEKE